MEYAKDISQYRFEQASQCLASAEFFLAEVKRHLDKAEYK